MTVWLASAMGTRFRGAQPFADDDISRRTFFGRDTALAALADRVLANRLVVVYARSGVGKSSLLNAGLMPRLREAGYQPLPVRVNDTRQGPKESLLDGVRAEARRQGVEFVDGDPRSLWSYFKTVEFWKGDLLLTPVLLLDQFEELFTLQGPEAREHFLLELGELIRGIGAANDGDRLDDTPPLVHVVLSLREDYLGLLEEAADRIPHILAQRFRLLPMSADEALPAMIGPAAIDDPLFTTRAFQLSPELTSYLLEYLSQRTTAATSRGRVEPFQLQLVCQRIEQIVAELDDPAITRRAITLDDLGGERALDRALAEFYGRAIKSLKDRVMRRRARRLCERHLISADGRRLSLEESEILRVTELSEQALRSLVDSRLLRVDRRTDANYYELSHDTLVAPILSTIRTFALLLGWASMALGMVLVIASWSAFAAIMPTLVGDESGPQGRELIALALGTGGGFYLGNRAWRYGSRTLNLFGGMPTLKSVLGRLLAVVVVITGFLAAGVSPFSLIYPASVISIFGVIIGFAGLAYPFSVLRRGLKALISDDPPSPEDCLRIEGAYRKLGEAGTVATSVIAAFGLTQMFLVFQAPERLGPSIAWLLTSVVMGIFVRLMITRPIELTSARLRTAPRPSTTRLRFAQDLPPPAKPAMTRIVGNIGLIVLSVAVGTVMTGGHLSDLSEPLPIVLGIPLLLALLGRRRGARHPQTAADTLSRAAQAALPAGLLATAIAFLPALVTSTPGALVSQLFSATYGLLLGILLHLILTALSIAYSDADSA